jgi:hypothetical protein
MRQIQLKSFTVGAALVALMGVSAGGFAAVSDVVSVGNDSYLVSSQANNGWSTRNAQKSKVYERAHAFCAAKGKEMQTVASKTSPRGLGQVAYAEIEFKCVDAAH